MNYKIVWMWLKRQQVSQSVMILFAAVFISMFSNYTFFSNLSATYPGQLGFLLSVFIIFVALHVLLLQVICFSRATKIILIGVFLVVSLLAYAADTFGIIVDKIMINNLWNTNLAEVLDLLSLKFFVFFIFLGVIPSVSVYYLKIKSLTFKKQLITKLRDIAICLLVIFVALLSYNRSYASFLREHKPLRYYANPIYFFYSSYRFFNDKMTDKNGALAEVGRDARIPTADTERELVVFILGETARSDHFSVNGYHNKTNPLLEKEDIISFKDVYSCGTSTATSVPCMFSIFGRSAFDHEDAAGTENLVDVLEHTGRIQVLWRDNNSDSKGVAIRVPYEDFKSPHVNTICDVECRDEGMLVGLQDYINRQKNGDVFIILHQMGNHGPAYFKRYPASFEVFKPACKSYDLGNCTEIEINNAYDNAILYTDYFLSKVIELLKQNGNYFETAMFYVSDHGESLGENGIYLHGLPYSIAPVEQRKVPFIMWFGDKIKDDINLDAVKRKTGNQYSHDNIFHTILRLMEVETGVYDKTKDILEYNYNY